MPRTLLILLIFLSEILHAQDNPRCEVWQYRGTDSSNKTLAKVIQYNVRGQKISEKFSGWMTSEREGVPDGTYTYFYTDTLLEKWMYGANDGDSLIMKFSFDAAGKLIRQSYFQLKSVGNTGGQLHIDGPGQTSSPRRWEQTSEVNFSYDTKGRLILFDASRLHYATQNMYKWTYDDQDRVTQHQSYSRGKLTWQEDYQYFDGSYRYWRIWYDASGNPKHENKENYEYQPLIFYNCTVDKQGRVIEEKLTDENKNLHGRTVTTYNKVGQIVRTVNYNAKNEQSVTHMYNYVK